jgi:hypothetical protein
MGRAARAHTRKNYVGDLHLQRATNPCSAP